jgi:hypothetical protein
MLYYLMITSKVLEIKKEFADHLPTRGEVAAQEQIRAFGQVFATKGEPRAPTTRGEVAAQEQMRIISKATGNFVQNRKPVEAK